MLHITLGFAQVVPPLLSLAQIRNLPGTSPSAVTLTHNVSGIAEHGLIKLTSPKPGFAPLVVAHISGAPPHAVYISMLVPETF